MDPSLNQPSPEVEEAEWDTDGFVIPSLTIGDSDPSNTNVPGVTDSKPPATTTIEAEKIYLGPHGAPPSQAKQQEVKASGRKPSFKHKLKEADRRFSGTGRENKVETLQQLVGGKCRSAFKMSQYRNKWLMKWYTFEDDGNSSILFYGKKLLAKQLADSTPLRVML